MSKKPYEYAVSMDEYRERLARESEKKMTDPHSAKELKKLSPSVYRRYREYRKEVDRLTKLQPLKTLRNFDKRGFRNYHLDHKVSVWYGFKNNIHPASIAHISNLQMVPYHKNLNKGHKNEGQMIIL